MNNPFRSKNRIGLTLVELVAMMAITGTLTSLLLPGVQGSREAARRQKCANNLKRYALAMHNYHDAYDSFPTPYYVADTDQKGLRSGSALGGVLPLMPFMEMASSYNEINEVCHQPENQAESGISTHLPYCKIQTTGGSDVFPSLTKPIPTLNCPSDPHGGKLFEIEGSGKTVASNYAWSYADTSEGTAWYVHFHTSLCAGTYYLEDPDPEISTRPVASERSPFCPCHWQKMTAIKDGTSNTLLLGEICVSPSKLVSRVTQHFSCNAEDPWDNVDEETRVTRGSLIEAKAAGVNYSEQELWDGSGVEGKVAFVALSRCLAWVDHANPENLKESAPVIASPRGFSMIEGGAAVSGFNTIAAPNSPNCAQYSNWFGLYPLQSYHPGGANAARVDGSVVFIPDDVDTGTYAETIFYNQKGKSPFGILGAMGTINGEESESL